MQIEFNLPGFIGFELLNQTARYALFAGGAFGLIWKWGRVRFENRRIQKRPLLYTQIRREIARSTSTILIFSAAGGVIFYNHAYFKFTNTGGSIPYWIGTYLLVMFLHDTYFYWTHRMLHLPYFYRRFHLAHHESHNPTPFTTYSFHPVEALVEASFIPIVAFFLPLQNGVIAGFVLTTTLFNLIGHLGYEFYGDRFVKSGLFKAMASSTHHNLHHARSRSNYGFYTRFWDRLCGTEDPQYEKQFLIQCNTDSSNTNLSFNDKS